MKLWIDDVRPAPESFIPCWEWVDTVNKAKNCITNRGSHLTISKIKSVKTTIKY